MKQQDLKGLGGILLEDVQESLPHCERALKHLAHEILYISRPTDKKKILFYNDKTATMEVKILISLLFIPPRLGIYIFLILRWMKSLSNYGEQQQ